MWLVSKDANATQGVQRTAPGARRPAPDAANAADDDVDDDCDVDDDHDNAHDDNEHSSRPTFCWGSRGHGPTRRS